MQGAVSWEFHFWVEMQKREDLTHSGEKKFSELGKDLQVATLSESSDQLSQQELHVFG